MNLKELHLNEMKIRKMFFKRYIIDYYASHSTINWLNINIYIFNVILQIYTIFFGT